ncbi:MAG TPA: RnfH family protein [Burkholderiales bacterium]|nr:RnfH family protein [Burkholderiales bacterium]
MRVEVVHARPEGAQIVEVRLPDGATVGDALAASGLKGNQVGIFGKRVSTDTRLKEGDRVEIYRPLNLDPKEARRRRAGRR